jgi:peptidoglycan/xylan/chitin deacetylase (PgdA/CDA1 family)
MGGEHGAIDRRMALRLGLGAAASAFVIAAGELIDSNGKGRRKATTDTTDASRPEPTPKASDGATAPQTKEGKTLSVSSPPEVTASPKAVIPATAPVPKKDLRFFGPSTGKEVYLTIDDGWYPNERVLDVIKTEHLPVTSFLIVDAGRKHRKFWSRFVDAGGTVQNHTVSHPWLTRVPPGEIEAQWAGASDAFVKWFGTRPTLGRPPYGAVDEAVWQAAENVGLSSLVMWSATDNGHGLHTWNKGPLAPGSIVLMHWDPGLYEEFMQVLQAIEAAGLVPTPLPSSWPPQAS